MRSIPAPATGECECEPPSRIGARKASTSSTSSASKNAPRTRPPPSTRRLECPRRPSSSRSGPIGTGPAPGNRKNLATRRKKRRDAVLGGSIGRRDQDGNLASGFRELGRGRQPGGGVEDDPEGRSGAGRPGGQGGVIGQGGADPDEEAVDLPSTLVDPGAGSGPGDPSAVAGGAGGLAVEGHRPLGDHVGSSGRQPFQIGEIESAGLLGGDPGADLDPRVDQSGEAAAGDAGERVSHRRDDADDPRGEDRVGAGGGLAEVAARFEADVERRSASVTGRRLDGDDLGMRAAESLVMAEPDEPAAANEDGPDHRIRLDAAPTALGLGERQAHPTVVVLRGGRDHRMPGPVPG